MTLVPADLQTFVIPAVIGLLVLMGILLGVNLRRGAQHRAELDRRDLQLRRIMDNSPEALMILDVTAGRFSLVNERAVELYGWPMEKLLQIGVVEVSPPLQPDGQPSRTAAMAMIQEAIQGGQPVFSWVHQNAAGQSIPCEVRLVRIPHESRILVRGSVVDISGRLQAEDQLRRSEERFRAVVNAQRELVCRWSPDGVRTFVNRAFCQYFGRSEQQLLGVNFLQELNAEERTRILENVGRLTPDESQIVREVRFARDDGQWSWLEWSDQGLFDHQGELVEIQAIGRDITARKKVQGDLEDTKSLLTAAMEASPAGIVIASAADGRVRLANRAVLDILGATEETIDEVLGGIRRDRFFYPDGSRIDAEDQPMQRALANGETSGPLEMRLQRPDGQERWITNSGAPVRNAAGEVTAGISVSYDITDSKRTQLAARSMVESVAGVTGQEFCKVLVLQLSKVLGVDISIIGQLAGGEGQIRMLALAMDGEISSLHPNFDSRESPSGEVLWRKRCMAWDNVREAFPDDSTLAENAVESYVGVPLLARDNRVLGVLAVMSRTAMSNVQFNTEILELFAVRAAAELERGQAELALVQSEERFRAAFEEAPIGSLMIDPEGWLRRANKAFCQLLGYSAEELATRRIDDIAHPDEVGRILRAKAELLSGKIRSEAGDGRLIRKDGRPVWINYSSRVLANPGEGALILLMVEDVSARRQAEEDLKASRDLQRLVAEISASFVGSHIDEADSQIRSALARVGEFLRLDRAVLYEMDGTEAVATHYWLSHGRDPAVSVIPTERVPVIRDHILGLENFKFTSLDELLDAAPAEHAIFTQVGIKSWIGIPLQVDRALAGVLSLGVDEHERAWPEHLVEWGRILGEMLASVVARKRAETDLRVNMELQRLVAEISASFVNAPVDGVDDQILGALKRVGEFLDLGRMCLYRLVGESAELAGYWAKEGAREPPAALALATQIPLLSARLISGEVISFESLEKLGEEAVERELFAGLGTRSWLAIPLMVSNVLVGAVTLASTDREQPWLPGLVQWLRVFGEMLAGAIARKTAEENQSASRRQLRGLTHELTRAEDRERRRCAIYLHDQISQSLAVMRMRFGELLRPGTQEERQACIGQIRGLLEQTIEDTQTLTFDLSPPVLYDLGLLAAIEWIGEKTCKENGIEMELEVVGEEYQIPRDAEPSSILFRAVRELLMNVVKHGKASEVNIRVEFSAGGVQIGVRDNGIGFDTAVLNPNKGIDRFGLFSIRERLNFIGGRFQVVSSPGSGTQVNISVPLETQAAASGMVVK